MAYKTIRRFDYRFESTYDFEDNGFQPTGGDEGEPEAARVWSCDGPGLEVWEMGPHRFDWVVGNGIAYGTASSFEAAAKCAIINVEWED